MARLALAVLAAYATAATDDARRANPDAATLVRRRAGEDTPAAAGPGGQTMCSLGDITEEEMKLAMGSPEDGPEDAGGGVGLRLGGKVKVVYDGQPARSVEATDAARRGRRQGRPGASAVTGQGEGHGEDEAIIRTA